MSLGLDYQIKDGVISVIKVDAGGPADKVGIKPGMQALIDCEVCARMLVSVCVCLV
jgi:predicted metalloprotease with PDZ domain